MRFLECLKSAGKIFHGNNYTRSMMKKSSVSRMQRKVYVMFWKGESESNIKHCLGRQVNMVQRVHHKKELWLHIFKIYLYICRLSRIVEDATTFEMELCVCASKPQHMHMNSLVACG